MNKDFNSSVPYGKSATVPFKKATKKTPDRMSNIHHIVAGALSSGLAAFVGGLFIVWALYSVGIPVKVGAAGFFGGSVMLSVLLIGLYRLARDTNLVSTFEEITGQDWNGDGVIGHHITEITVQDNRGGWQRTKLPFHPDVIVEWGRAYLGGQSTAYAAWSNKFALRPDFKDGEENYRRFRQLLVDRKLARENGTHSIDLTSDGVDLFQMLVYNDQDELTPLLME